MGLPRQRRLLRPDDRLSPRHISDRMRSQRHVQGLHQGCHDAELLWRDVHQPAHGPQQLRHLRARLRPGSVVLRRYVLRVRRGVLQRILREYERRPKQLRRLRPRLRLRGLLAGSVFSLSQLPGVLRIRWNLRALRAAVG